MGGRGETNMGESEKGDVGGGFAKHGVSLIVSQELMPDARGFCKQPLGISALFREQGLPWEPRLLTSAVSVPLDNTS